MTIEFSQIPASIRKPGAYIEFNTALAARSLPSNRQTMLLIGQRLNAAIGPKLFSPADDSAMNDCDPSGTFTGSVRRKFVVKISTAGGTDKFDWSKDGGLTWDATGVSATGAAQSLVEGVSITLTAT